MDNLSAEKGGLVEATLTHGDFRGENIFFDCDGTGPNVRCVIDHQGAKENHGAFDIAYLLQGSMEASLRKEHEAALVQSYFTALKEAAEECGNANLQSYSFEHFLFDYQMQAVLAFISLSMAFVDLHEKANQLPEGKGRDHGIAVIELWCKRGLQHLEDLDCWENFEALQSFYSEANIVAAKNDAANLQPVTEAQIREYFERIPAYLKEGAAQRASTTARNRGAKAETKKGGGWLW